MPRRPSVSFCLVRPCQRQHAEQAVAPYLERRPAGSVRQRLKCLERVFVAVLGVDGFAGAESDRLAVDADFLPPGAGKVHLDAAVLTVVAGMMLERTEIEIGTELAIDAGQQIKV